MEKKGRHSREYYLTVEEFEKLYKRYYQNFLRFSTKLIGDKNLAQDIVHEVFIKLWEKRFEIKDDGIDKLLFTMTRNACLNHIKHETIVLNKQVDLKQIRKWEELYRIEYLNNEPYALIEKELEEQINKVIYKLPDKCREVYILSRKKGLKNWEIAEKMNISLKTVEKHISRAMREFKKQFNF